MNKIIFNADLNCGSQAFGGSLGIRFSVAKYARVTDLGWFDNNGNGMSGTPTFYCYITTVDGVTTYASTTFSSGDQGTRYDSGPFRFKSITPVILAPGEYMLWGYGFNASNLNGNSAIAAVNATSDLDGGILTLPTSPTYYHGSTGITVPNTAYSTGLQFASFSMMLFAVDGGGCFGGSADASYSVLTNSHTASGKAVLGNGGASLLRLPFDVPRAAAVLGGGSSFKLNLVRAAAGGGCFGGSAGVVFRIAAVASGGLCLGSAASVGLVLPFAAGGLLVTNGAASAGVVATAAPGGGAAVFGGGGAAGVRLASVAAAGAVFGGTAAASLTLVVTSYSYSASGGGCFGGSAVLPASGISGEVEVFLSSGIAGEVEILPAFSFDLTSL